MAYRYAMKSLADRIVFVLEEMDWKPADLARAINVSRSAITRMLRGPTKVLKSDTAAEIERKTGVSATWLATGTGEPRKRPGPLPDTDSEQIEYIYNQLIRLPKAHREKVARDIEFLVSLNEPAKSD